MKKAIFGFIFHRLLGWREYFDMPIPRKCIACVAPHTSNWDLIIGKLFGGANGIEFRFLIKNTWFFFPMNLVFGMMGGIPVNRDVKTGLVGATAKLFKETDDLIVVVTPEGTRKPNANWKKGFYFIAKEAEIPILLIGLDFKKKLVECTMQMTPGDDVEKDMQAIKEHFSQYTGKKPENFIC